MAANYSKYFQIQSDTGKVLEVEIKDSGTMLTKFQLYAEKDSYKFEFEGGAEVSQKRALKTADDGYYQIEIDSEFQLTLHEIDKDGSSNSDNDIKIPLSNHISNASSHEMTLSGIQIQMAENGAWVNETGQPLENSDESSETTTTEVTEATTTASDAETTTGSFGRTLPAVTEAVQTSTNIRSAATTTNTEAIVGSSTTIGTQLPSSNGPSFGAFISWGIGILAFAVAGILFGKILLPKIKQIQIDNDLKQAGGENPAPLHKPKSAKRTSSTPKQKNTSQDHMSEIITDNSAYHPESQQEQVEIKPEPTPTAPTQETPSEFIPWDAIRSRANTFQYYREERQFDSSYALRQSSEGGSFCGVLHSNNAGQLFVFPSPNVYDGPKPFATNEINIIRQFYDGAEPRSGAFRYIRPAVFVCKDDMYVLLRKGTIEQEGNV